MERREQHIPDVQEVFARIAEIDDAIISIKSGPYKREEVKDLYLNKARNMVILLQAKNAGIVGLRTGLSRFGNDDLHELSQNALVINNPFNSPGLRYRNSKIGIDLMAESIGATSLDILQMIGATEYVISESPYEMVRRNFDEVRASQRKYKQMIEEGEIAKAEELDRLRLTLTERIVRVRNFSPDPSLQIVTKKVVGKNGDIMSLVLINPKDKKLGQTNYISLPNTPELDEMFAKYRGYDKDETK